MIQIALCDDDYAVRQALRQLISRQNLPAELFEYPSGEALLRSGRTFDICVLDIAMQPLSGMELARQLRRQEPPDGRQCILIFVTGHREYMEEAFDVHAFHYLLKPIDTEKFAAVFNQAWREAAARAEQSRNFLFVKCAGTQRRLFLNEIFYIESGNKKVIFHTTDGTLAVYGKMADLEQQLDGQFYRCHRCYLVNLEKISAYSADSIQLTNGDRLLLARKKYAAFIQTYMRYVKNGGIVHV